jgi:Fic family protein
MQIFQLVGLKVEPNIEERLRDADSELSSLRGLGEFSAEVQQEIYRSFLPDRISDTLNMEGIRVNPRITKAIMEGLSLSDTDRYSELEVLNIISADELIESDARLRRPLTVGTIKEIQRRVANGLVPDAGSYRQQDVRITGAKRQPPAWFDVQSLVTEACGILNASRGTHAIIRAAWLHATIAAIHPFSDGNGRTARLMQDYVLIENGFLPVGIPISRREKYYDSLERADNGDFGPLIEIIVGSELLALDKMRRIAENPSKRMERVRKILAVANAKTQQIDHKEYDLWRRQVIGLRDEIVRWTDELNKNSANLFLETYTYDPISFDQWCEIRKGAPAKNTWLLSLKLYVNQTPVYNVLFYVQRHKPRLVGEEGQSRAVGVFLTGCDDGALYSFSGFADPYISLREVAYSGTQLLVYSIENHNSAEIAYPSEPEKSRVDRRWKLDTESSITDVIEQFFVDLFTKLGLN